MTTMDHFHLDTFQGSSTGMFTISPHSYRQITFLDENRQPIRIAQFVKDMITKKIPKPSSQGTLDSNLRVHMGIDEMLDDLKKTGVFKSSLIIPRYNRPESLTVLLKRKSPYYFSMQQTFNTEGHITLSYSGGLRNIGGMLDTLSFSYEKSLQRDKLAQVNFNWSLPFFPGNTSLDLGYYSGSSSLDNHIIEKRDSASIKFSLPHNQTTFKYSIEDRQNLFDPDDVSRRVLLHEVFPTLVHKFELGVQCQKSKTSQTDLKLTQTQGDVIASAIELDWKIKYSLSPLMKAHWPNKYTKLTFENLFMVKTIPLGYDLRINDAIHFSQLRGYNKVGRREPAFNIQRHPRHHVDGFRHQGDHLGSRFGLRNTSKVIFDGYPYLKDSSMLKTFLHFTTIVTDPDFIPRRPNISMASGIGIDLVYGPAHIEFLYNYWHRKNKDDHSNYFQVKFAFGD